MTDFESSDSEAAGYVAGGPIELEFVDAPALNGEDVAWTFRTKGGRTAPAGTIVTQIAVMSHDHKLLGGGSTTVHSDLGPHDIGGSRIHPVQYTADDGDYYLSLTIGSDVRYVSYRVHDRRVHAI
jgi:hypothetical protein